MKSVFNKIEKEKSKEIEFPVLAEALVRDESFVVLFLSKNTGVVVKGNLSKDVGYLRSNFVSVTNETRWRILSPEESIVVSYEEWLLIKSIMLTRELIESLFDIKDGEFYHKPKLEADARIKEWNRRYSGKKAGHVDGIGRYRVGIKDKWYKVSDILDMFETCVFVVKT